MTHKITHKTAYSSPQIFHPLLSSYVLARYLTTRRLESQFIFYFFLHPSKTFFKKWVFFHFTIGSEQDIKRRERRKKKNLKGNFLKCTFRRGSRHLPKASLWSTEAAETANSITNTISILFPFCLFLHLYAKQENALNVKQLDCVFSSFFL